jgi:WD40 repeat protein
VEDLLKPVLTLVQAGASCKWTYDSQRFILEFFDTIHNSPSQIYHYALPFSPPSSWLYKCYATGLLQSIEVVKGQLPPGWGRCSRTVTLYETFGPSGLACWKETIAVGFFGGHIILLDAITGSQVAVLSGHTERVRSLTFLPDGTSLVSGSDDNTLKLWDIQTGGVAKTFHGHIAGIHSVSVSSDIATIASGSRDMTIRLWDIQTGGCRCIIEQKGEVTLVVFSPMDPQHLISESWGVIQQWDSNGNQIGSTYKGYHAAFSSDGTHFVLYGREVGREVVTVQNSSSGAIVAKFSPDSSNPDEYFGGCCFSPDGGLIVIAAHITIYIWDITSQVPHLVETFIGHDSKIISIAFSSSSLISASHDMSVKFWQIGTLSTNPVATAISPTPLILASIQSITPQTRDGIVITSDLAGVVRVWDISTGFCKTSFQTPARVHTLRDVQMVNGKLILVWNMEEEKEIYVWDIEKGESLQTLEACDLVGGLRISGDGSKVFCVAGDFIQAWSMWTGEAVGNVEFGAWACLDPLHVDGSKIWIHFQNAPPRGWDFGISGSPPTPLSNTLPERPYLHFINSPWESGQARMRDTVTGKEVFQLSGRYANPSAVGWDGQYLVAGYGSGEVVILDCHDLCTE